VILANQRWFNILTPEPKVTSRFEMISTYSLVFVASEMIYECGAKENGPDDTLICRFLIALVYDPSFMQNSDFSKRFE
jgi:hypothetical protein